MQDKVTHWHKTQQENKAAREQAKRSGHEALRKLQNHKPMAAALPTQAALELLELELKASERLRKEWPRILQEHAEEMQEQAAKLQRQNEQSELILRAYQSRFGMQS